LITESFLNSCFSIILNKKTKIKKTKSLYRDILEVLQFCESKETIDIPIILASKLECIKKILEMLLTDKTIDNIIDSITFSEKFKQYREFLDIKINENLKDNIIQDCINQIKLRKKINTLFQNYDQLNKVLDTIKDGSFDSIDNLINDYEVTIKTLYSNMMKNNRIITIESSSSLDLVNDSYDSVIKMIKKKYNKVNKTSSGFSYLDNEILNGGFEPSRLYIWAGGSGSGKSVMLNNTIIYSATQHDTSYKNYNLESSNTPKKINKVYIYITCENTIEESLMRTYMPMFNKTTEQMLRDITNGVNIKEKIINKLSNNNTTIIMKYFPAMSISSFDIMSVIDDVIEIYGKQSIAGLYIDYLDLLKTDIKYDIYRIELGHITLSLKTLAVQYNIPVITATQLGRTAYRINDSNKLNIDSIGESIKKVEHADFVGLIAKDPIDDTIVHCKIGKNRAGKANTSIDFKVDFSKFKFLKAFSLSKKTSNNENAMSNNSNLLQINSSISNINPISSSGY
jgi:replicative DNA helicase